MGFLISYQLTIYNNDLRLTVNNVLYLWGLFHKICLRQSWKQTYERNLKYQC